QAGFLPSLLTGTISGQKTSILRTQPRRHHVGAHNQTPEMLIVAGWRSQPRWITGIGMLYQTGGSTAAWDVDTIKWGGG
ncbi:hypothetical protein, partial [Aeromonas enteropelogenes]|uniref:hypothetical protein n=1 Tax=Aeromonas enteropelogenes TaxID=29489 RepID=UPI003B9DCD04